MITQISGPSLISATKKDPRRKAQSVKFRNQVNIPYTHKYEGEYAKQQRNALWTSALIVLGSVLFMVGYFMLAGIKARK